MKLSTLSQKVHGGIVLAFGIAILMGLLKARQTFVQQRERLQVELNAQNSADQIRSQFIHELRSIRDLKSRDIMQLKAGLSGMAESKRLLYEAGLTQQDEKRSLEKLKEILTTYLKMDEEKKRILILQGDQILMDFPMGHPVPQALGGETRPLNSPAQIVSKERFAHPERGTAEEVDGTLQWNPPQVGNSVRSNALGEFVIFTNGPLILHGPPKKEAEHSQFPHVCAGLSQGSAQKIYSKTYIGTKIVFAKAPVNGNPAAPAIPSAPPVR